MNRTIGTKAGAVLVALLTLAVLSSRASPGFPLADVPMAVGKTIAKALGAKPKPPAIPKGSGGQRGASSSALAAGSLRGGRRFRLGPESLGDRLADRHRHVGQGEAGRGAAAQHGQR